jgi:hypothetical protein
MVVFSPKVTESAVASYRVPGLVVGEGSSDKVILLLFCHTLLYLQERQCIQIAEVLGKRLASSSVGVSPAGAMLTLDRLHCQKQFEQPT